MIIEKIIGKWRDLVFPLEDDNSLPIIGTMIIK
jgi:hypothetical protein